MTEIPDDIADLIDAHETNPLKLVIEIEKRVRPPADFDPREQTDSEIVHRYYLTVKHACELFGVDFGVNYPDEESYGELRRVFYLTKTEMDKKKIELLYQKFDQARVIVLDETWQSRIHSYIAHIREIVGQADLSIPIRERILVKLNDLGAEVDRLRAPIQKFADVFVELCGAISAGAVKLTPAVRLLERVTGAVARVNSSKPQQTLMLPPPEELGLEGSDTPPPEC